MTRLLKYRFITLYKRFWLINIFILASFLQIWLCSTDQFLHEWDERYHALVARNLLSHPLMPTLYESPLLDYDYREWASNHIWLSKPPLPLWFIALSLKLWGFTEWAVRFPSILFSLASVFLTYKIAWKLFGRKVALWAAFFQAINGLLLEVSSGRFSSDHVETIFLFWMELGFWAMIRYFLTPPEASSRIYLFLFGVATGLAFMCKWTSAFLLPIVGISISAFSGKLLNVTSLKAIAIIAVVFLAIASPWVAYIYYNYPHEATFLFKSIVSPVTETVQGHTGEWYYYLGKVRLLFGEIIYVPLLWLLWMTIKEVRKPSETISKHLIISCWIFVPLIILSMAATKRHTYILPTAPAFFILTALFMDFILQYWQKPSQLNLLGRLIWAALIILPIRYSIERSKVFFERDNKPLWAQQLKALPNNTSFRSSQVVVFNEPHPIEAMFYTGFTAYSWIPPIEKINQIKNKGWLMLEYKNGTYVELLYKSE